jgi:hypothetical protein
MRGIVAALKDGFPRGFPVHQGSAESFMPNCSAKDGRFQWHGGYAFCATTLSDISKGFAFDDASGMR